MLPFFLSMQIPWRKIFIGELSWQRFFRSCALLYGIFFVGSCSFSEKLIFPYRGTSYDNTLPGLEMIPSEDGTQIATRYLRARDEKYLLLHFHGNYEDMGRLDPLYDEFLAHQWSILAMDYRGYGLSEGAPKEKDCYRDAEALYQHALKLGYRPEQIILWGRSVGGGLAVELALHREAHALVLESTFASAFRVATKIPIFPFDRFNNLKKIDSVEEPLFVLHGDQDTIIPAWHTEKLFLKHQGPKERHLIEGAGHNDLPISHPDVVRELRRFFAVDAGVPIPGA